MCGRLHEVTSRDTVPKDNPCCQNGLKGREMIHTGRTFFAQMNMGSTIFGFELNKNTAVTDCTAQMAND